MQSTTAFSGGCRHSPTTSRILVSRGGSVENLNVCVRHGCTPKRCQIRAMVVCEMGVPSPASAEASSREDQWVTPKAVGGSRSEEHTSELQSRQYLVCRLLLEKKKKIT